MPEPTRSLAATAGSARSCRRLFPILAGLELFTLFAWLAGRELLADVYLGIAYQAAASGDRRPASEKWRQATQYFTDSLRHSPRNPYALEAIGAHEITGMRSGADLSRSPTDMLHGAAEHLRRALLERPTSPNAWANRSVLHKANGDYDMREGEGRLMYRLMLTGPAPTAAYQ